MTNNIVIVEWVEMMPDLRVGSSRLPSGRQIRDLYLLGQFLYFYHEFPELELTVKFTKDKVGQIFFPTWNRVIDMTCASNIATKMNFMILKYISNMKKENGPAKVQDDTVAECPVCYVDSNDPTCLCTTYAKCPECRQLCCLDCIMRIIVTNAGIIKCPLCNHHDGTAIEPDFMHVKARRSLYKMLQQISYLLYKRYNAHVEIAHLLPFIKTLYPQHQPPSRARAIPFLQAFLS